METVIHEALHGCSYAKSEELVTVSARDIARLMRRLGFKWEKATE
jgi:histone H3/H4